MWTNQDVCMDPYRMLHRILQHSNFMKDDLNHDIFGVEYFAYSKLKHILTVMRIFGAKCFIVSMSLLALNRILQICGSPDALAYTKILKKCCTKTS